MQRSYYTLLVRDDENDFWQIHFGDYRRSIVAQERIDICEHDYLKKNTKIIRTADHQNAIIQAVKTLNAPFDPPFKIIQMTPDNIVDVHNAIADATGDPHNKLKS